MLLELAFSVDSNQNVVWGEMRIHPEFSISSSEIIGIYNYATTNITYDQIMSEGYDGTSQPAYYVTSYNEKYTYDGVNVTEQNPTLSKGGWNDCWVPDADVVNYR